MVKLQDIECTQIGTYIIENIKENNLSPNTLYLTGVMFLASGSMAVLEEAPRIINCDIDINSAIIKDEISSLIDLGVTVLQ